MNAIIIVIIIIIIVVVVVAVVAVVIVVVIEIPMCPVAVWGYNVLQYSLTAVWRPKVAVWTGIFMISAQRCLRVCRDNQFSRLPVP